MRIVFMGTPDFAAKSLSALLENGYDVVAVYCQPDKPKGRGHHLQAPPVKVLALENDIPVYQPTTLKTAEAAEQLRSLNPDLIAVTAYGKLLPLSVLEIPKYGCVNVHGSLLPLYRGAAPIQWSVLNGDTQTGITTMLMAQGMDTGDILLQECTPIGENETSAELFDRLSELGGNLLCETIKALQAGAVTPIKQEHEKATLAPMLSKELCPLDFSLPAIAVHNRIRGLSDWPCATTTIDGNRIKIYKSRISGEKTDAKSGTLLSESEFLIACGDGGVVSLLEVQGEGGKRMDGASFLRGKRLKAAMIAE